MPEREWKYASVDLADNSTIVESEPCLVKSVIVTTDLSAHNCPIKDDATTVWMLGSSSSIATKIEEAGGIRFETSLVVDPDDSATGMITISYRLLRDP